MDTSRIQQAGAARLTFLVVILWLAIIGLVIHEVFQEDRVDQAASGVGPSPTLGPTHRAAPSSTGDVVPAPEAAFFALPESPGAEPAKAEDHTEPLPELGVAPDAHALARLSPGFQPTAKGLYDYTIEQWNQPGFVDLSKVEAEKLLGEVLGTYPTTMVAYVGGYPTLDDCLRAIDLGLVRTCLERLIALDCRLMELEGTLASTRSAGMQELIDEMLEARDAAEENLWQELDNVSGYKNWRLLGRLFRRWSRGDGGTGTPTDISPADK